MKHQLTEDQKLFIKTFLDSILTQSYSLNVFPVIVISMDFETEIPMIAGNEYVDSDTVRKILAFLWTMMQQEKFRMEESTFIHPEEQTKGGNK
jgi:hypothetical protein